MILLLICMTVLLQTRLPREKAARLKAAQAEGKSMYQALRELAEGYAQKGKAKKFACLDYPERPNSCFPEGPHQTTSPTGVGWSAMPE